jgi:serine protease
MKTSFLLAILIIISGILHAQQFDPKYTDGRIWFKVKTTTTTSNQKKGNDPKAIITTREVGAVPLEIRQLPVFSGSRSTQQQFKFYSPVKTKPELFPDLFYVEYKQLSVEDPQTIINSLVKSGLVEYAEREPRFETFHDPNDPLKTNQWSLEKVKAFEAWELLLDKPFMTNGSPIIIAVVDDAINIEHEDLVDVLWINTGEIPGNGIDDDNNGYIDDYYGVDVTDSTFSPMPPANTFNHGTHVAGIAAAKTNNGKGVSSLGYNLKLMAIKATTQAGYVNAGYSGIIYAIENGAHIINCSWGGYPSSQVLQDIIDMATQNNIMVVGAAGNFGNDNLVYPASYNGVISVANTNQSDVRHTTSNYGPRIDISAPGFNIYSTRASSATGYEYKTGTSMAAPMVSSLLGLMKSIDPTIPNVDIKGCLLSTAVNIDDLNPAYAGQLGAGRINAEEAIKCVLALTESPPGADFRSNIQQISAGASINFINQSSYSPTTFQWFFEGGTPATYVGETPPPIVYENEGSFDVTLIVSNAYGSDTVTKPNYIIATEGIPCEAKNRDNNWTWGLYVTSNNPNSWLAGTNTTRMIEEKAMFFDFTYSTATHVTRTYLEFFSNTRNLNNHQVVPLKIYDGTNGTPGALLYIDSSITYAQIVNDIIFGRGTYYYHEKAVELPASKKIFIAVDFTSLCSTGNCNDDLTLITTTNGAVPNSVWEKLNNSWVQYGFAGSFSYAGNFSIYPYITGIPFQFNFKLPPAICLNQPADFDGSEITTNGNWSVWYDGDSSARVFNTLNLNQAFSTPGIHSISINATGGACLDHRVNTQTFIVKDTPTIQHNILSSQVCSGSVAEINVTGAENYYWVNPGFINGYDKDTISVVLNESTNISLIGTTEGCSSYYDFFLPVEEAQPSTVSLTSNNTLTEPDITITFTASGNNLGNNPVYHFYVNNIVRQSGAANTYDHSNPQLGDRINVVVTNISGCTLNTQPASNAIVLSLVTLPIHFDYFDAKANTGYNEIKWKLSNIQTGKKVTLEKSTDGINFQAIAEFDFVANAPMSVKDADLATLQFYRIKLLNINGETEYSNALKIQREISQQVKVYPSIIQGNQPVNISMTDKSSHNYTVEVLNSSGQIVNVHLINGSRAITLNTHSKGMYYIRIRNEFNKIIKLEKVIVQ